MDPVPKKINRHVFKALQSLSSSDNPNGIRFIDVYDRVKFTTRNLTPVPNLRSCVHRSMQMYENSGLIKRKKFSRYIIGERKTFQECSFNPHIFCSYFKKTDPLEKSRCDPEARRKLSDDSISGDEFEKTRKRCRGIPKMLRPKRVPPPIPHARRHIIKIKKEKLSDRSPEDTYSFVTLPKSTKMNKPNKLRTPPMFKEPSPESKNSSAMVDLIYSQAMSPGSVTSYHSCYKSLEYVNNPPEFYNRLENLAPTASIIESSSRSNRGRKTRSKRAKKPYHL